MPQWHDTTFTWWYPEHEDEAILNDNGRAQGVALVPWELRKQARHDFVGYSALESGPQGSWIARRTPMPWPEEEWMYCTGSPRATGAGTNGFDLISGLSAYKTCRLTLAFQALTYDVRQDEEVWGTTGPLVGKPDEGDALRRGIRRYITVQGKMGGKVWTIPQGILRFPDGQPILQGSMAKQIPFVDLVYTWHQIPEDALPKSAWTEGMGRINDAEFDGFPAETLLFGAPSHSIPRRDVRGTRIVDVQYPARFQPNYDKGGTARGHNYMLRAYVSGGSTILDYQIVKTAGTTPATPNGDAPFRTYDFAKWFRPTQ